MTNRAKKITTIMAALFLVGCGAQTMISGNHRSSTEYQRKLLGDETKMTEWAKLFVFKGVLRGETPTSVRVYSTTLAEAKEAFKNDSFGEVETGIKDSDQLTLIEAEGPFPDLGPGSSGSIGQETRIEIQRVRILVDESRQQPISSSMELTAESKAKIEAASKRAMEFVPR